MIINEPAYVLKCVCPTHSYLSIFRVYRVDCSELCLQNRHNHVNRLKQKCTANTMYILIKCQYCTQ